MQRRRRRLLVVSFLYILPDALESIERWLDREREKRNPGLNIFEQPLDNPPRTLVDAENGSTGSEICSPPSDDCCPSWALLHAR